MLIAKYLQVSTIIERRKINETKMDLSLLFIIKHLSSFIQMYTSKQYVTYKLLARMSLIYCSLTLQDKALLYNLRSIAILIR